MWKYLLEDTTAQTLNHGQDMVTHHTAKVPLLYKPISQELSLTNMKD